MKANINQNKVNEAAEAILDAIINKVDKVNPDSIHALSGSFVNVVNSSIDTDKEPRGRTPINR